MNPTLVLDSSLVGDVTRKPGQYASADAFRIWLKSRMAAGWLVYVPEIVDYEVRRELIRTGRTASITRLDFFLITNQYLPLTTNSMRRAAQLWAQARNGGWATADPKAIDGDVILAAQAQELGATISQIIVVTENVAHISRYVTAQRWVDIKI